MVPNSWALVDPYITPLNVFIDPAFASEVKSGDVMLVADCNEAVIFMVTDITPTGMISHTASATTNRCENWDGGGLNLSNADVPCTSMFPTDNIAPTTAFGKLETVIFFVANDPTSDPANPRPTLFRRVMLATGDIVETTALVEGVENFQVLYGVDDMPPPPSNDGAADRYVTADNVGDFARVVSVQIGLLVYGVNATGTSIDTGFDTDIHDVAGTSIVPAANSKRKRRVFNTTIQLRNRGI